MWAARIAGPIPLILNWLQYGLPPFRPILLFPLTFPSCNQFRMSGMGLLRPPPTVIPA